MRLKRKRFDFVMSSGGWNPDNITDYKGLRNPSAQIGQKCQGPRMTQLSTLFEHAWPRKSTRKFGLPSDFVKHLHEIAEG